MAANVFKIELSREELGQVLSGLTLARASALRLSNRQGQVPTAIDAYKAEYNRLNALMMKLSHHATVS